MRVILFIVLFFFAACTSEDQEFDKPAKRGIDSRSNHLLLGDSIAKQQVRKALLTNRPLSVVDTLIPSKEIAISIAEPLLFHIYGKEQILAQKPYEVYLIDSYWYLAGTIPVGSKGGGFELILSASTCEIVRLTHYK